MTTTNRGRAGRPRKGSLYWTKSGWRARLTVDVDGVAVQKSFDLETRDRHVAKIKLRRLASETHAPAELAAVAASVETFEQAAERIVGESTIRTKKPRLDRLKKHVYPAIGPKLVTEIVAGDVRELLGTLADDGASKETCIKIRNDVSSVLGELWRADMISENVCAKVRIPKHASVDRRERAVLADDELLRYLGWQHPNEKKQAAVLERQTMACVSRMFGGVRLGDLKAIRWEAFDIGSEGTFATGWAPRSKTARAQLLTVPAMLRPILRDWWERQGRPRAGFVFPVRRGARAGEQRKAGSPAMALRRDLERAFGVVHPVERVVARSNGRKLTKTLWEPARPMTPREVELLTETEFTRPVEFHSFRRAFKQALAEAGVELQTAMTLSGATDAKAHQRYLHNTGKARVIPLAALPGFSMVDAETPEPENEIQGGRSRDRTYGFVRVKDALYR